MAHCATQLFECYVFACHCFYNVGASDEHVACLAHHEDEVGHGGRVHGATSARAKNDGDLWDNTRRLNVAMKDAAITGE